MIIAFDHVHKNGVQHADVLIIPGPELPRRHASDRPEAIHTDNAAVFARTSIASPAPDSHTSQNDCAAP